MMNCDHLSFSLIHTVKPIYRRVFDTCVTLIHLSSYREKKVFVAFDTALICEHFDLPFSIIIQLHFINLLTHFFFLIYSVSTIVDVKYFEMLNVHS